MSTAEAAQNYVRRMISAECKGWGDQENAMSRLERKYGLPFWSLNRIRTGKAKTIEAGLFQRIRFAYLDLCERQLARLEHEIAVEKALNEDATLEDLETEMRVLAEKIAARKARLK